jgi:hypothetical protein
MVLSAAEAVADVEPPAVFARAAWWRACLHGFVDEGYGGGAA